ncbi:hypothetical protein L3Q82_000777 [Scortum barcoo]|uniref:Uncharacterized protein n=1 Tax=Scortum barcoo TaxID=214431 RepID=A0ACB8WDC6_9TELE|nr:hypothetical protein L3Q82_000777 [Scortum barcoo]
MSITFNFDAYYSDLDETNHTNETLVVDPQTVPCQRIPLDPSAAVTLCVILIIIFLLAIPGNLIVALVIGSSRQVLTPSDVYLFHLTIADGLMALTLPFWAVAEINGWIFGDFLCKFLSLVIEANFYTSILFLACISIDRYLVIVRARESLRSRQRVHSRLLCTAVWALGWALALPALFNEASKPEPGWKMTCAENFDIGSAYLWRLVTRVFRHIFGFLLPLSVMMFCYCVTVTTLLHSRGFQKHRAMKVIIAVVIAFLLCWTPYHITMVVDTLLRAELIPFDCAQRRSVSLALDVTGRVALVHSCINPVLYAFVGEKFRGKLGLLFQRMLRQERMSGSKFSRSTSQSSDGGAVF